MKHLTNNIRNPIHIKRMPDKSNSREIHQRHGNKNNQRLCEILQRFRDAGER